MRRDAARSAPGQAAPVDFPKRTSTLVNRNVTVGGHRTSIRLEPVMWEALHQICRREGKSLNQVVTEIDRSRVESSLTAAIRVFLLRYYSDAATDEGHRLAGHGSLSHQLPLKTQLPV
jgi:predicted DNA-binding ribbon-helix-helix protein